MDTYVIAVANKRYAKKWDNKEVTFDELCERLEKSTETFETSDEYKRMRKDRRDDIKDVGGFVGGALEKGQRKTNSVKYRSLLTLDIDHADKDFIDRVYMFCTNECFIYSTHSHTPESPRLRLVMPLKHNVTPDEYGAIARYVAQEWGEDLFDKCSFRANQLMYWPSHSKDIEPVARRLPGDILDPDAILAAHPNWRDLSEMGADRESLEGVSVQADPLTKPGIIGAFCRAFSIPVAISTFISNIYTPTGKPDRYHYAPSDSIAGVVVYDDKWAYSNHATDPAYGQLLNAFDLVRIHKFGEESDEKSYADMVEFARHQPKVRRLIVAERHADAVQDFSGADAENDELDWESTLEISKRGEIKNDYGNYIRILRYDPELKGLSYDMFTYTMAKNGAYPWRATSDVMSWSDRDFAQLQAYIYERYGIFTESSLRAALDAVTYERKFHPVRQYLESLPEWDGIDRVDTLLIDYLGAEDNAFTREAMRKTLLAAVTRVYNPGAKFDTALILNGPQGIGKSTLFKRLAVDWFSDSLMLTDMRDKSGAENIQGRWFVEIAELAGMRKMEVETVKAFLSRMDDRYRASYGRQPESHPRQCVIVGSTNAQDGFLRDLTGNRRFWVVYVPGTSNLTPWELSETDVQQIWAEVMTIYAAETEDLLLSPEALGLAVEAQEAALEIDERAQMVERYLNTPVPADWYEKSLLERVRYFRDAEDGMLPENGGILRDRISVFEIWCECFGRDGSELDKNRSNELAAILRQLGWDRSKTARLKGCTKPVKAFLRPDGMGLAP